MDQKFENWLPLESNTILLNKYLANLGVNTDFANFVDIVSFEPEFLIPGSLGALFVYPDSPAINNYFFEQGDKMFEKPIPHSLYYMKQIAENACGTIALLHILANIPKEYQFIINEESFCPQFIQNTINMTPEERAEYLKNCKLEVKKKDGSVKSLQDAHKEVAQENLEDPNIELKAGHHFIAFVWHNGSVIELDGRKKAPIIYADCQQELFLEKVIEICQKHYIEKDLKEIGFNLMAFQIGFE
ncbi:unnamed protein product (macronuclear) [Paramecium tetraurelia]|uniref:Ubiquitin carboxyl-terminal hydrolase n=1 Tax=Paramecium tetraurelia TaxID=5888 RepID=A0CWS3_PARTE|nr:uncharacterized protein GSPATT00001443001 [Paramecium tetraurelia]CAK75240.1 unnamed protein product [Paramecium tetraurelia]|eukprot:XP_001442637.1 hypothetical protein (macronuclear) [Paramecium tetraurelia strain d4-2]